MMKKTLVPDSALCIRKKRTVINLTYVRRTVHKKDVKMNQMEVKKIKMRKFI